MMTMILVLNYLTELLRLQPCALVTRGAIAGEATNHASLLSWMTEKKELFASALEEEPEHFRAVPNGPLIYRQGCDFCLFTSDRIENSRCM